MAGEGIDSPVDAHYGSFNKVLEERDGFVDLSHCGVVRITGPDRLTWLHSLTTQHVESLPPHVPTAALILSPQGHVEHALTRRSTRTASRQPRRSSSTRTSAFMFARS